MYCHPCPVPEYGVNPSGNPEGSNYCHSRASGNPESFSRKIQPREQQQYFVYIMASKRNGTLYVGVTSDLVKRVYQHRNNLVDGFTKNYNLHILVYYEAAGDVNSAIQREKQIKRWYRGWKVALIEQRNPDWRDLGDEL